MPTLAGVKVLKLPTTELRESVRWYRRVFGAEPVLEFPDIEDGVIRGVALELPDADCGIALREAPEQAAGVRGFNLAVWSVEGLSDIEAWAAHLDKLGIPHSPTITATQGWMLIFSDPDGIEHHLYTRERHGLDMGHEPRAGRTPAPGAWD